MSSSPTEHARRRHDAPDGRLGRRGHRRRVEEAARRLGRADEIIASISTDKIDTDVEAPASGRVQEMLVEVGDDGRRRRRAGAHRDRRQARRGARVRERVRQRGHARGGGRAGGARRRRRAAGRHGRRARRHRPARAPAARRSGARRYSPVVMRIAAEHGIDLEQVEGTGRGGRVRKPDVLAYLESANGGAAAKRRRCTSRAPTSPTRRPRRASRKPRFGPGAAAAAPAGAGRPAPLSRMRQSIGRAMVESLQTAATCTTIIEADMTADRRRTREKTGLTWLPVRGARDDRDAGRVPVAQRDARGRDVHEYDGGQPRHRGLARARAA